MLAYNPYMQFFDTDGEVLNGGSVYIYSPGTTTLLDTYPTSADALAGTNANPNPITLDSAGRPSSGGNPIDIYVTQSYKMVVKNASGATIRTIDNIVTLGQLISTSAKSSTYTVTLADRDKLIVVDTTGGAVTINLPQASTAGDGFLIRIKKMDSSGNAITVDGYASETIDGSTTASISSSYQYGEFICDGTRWIKCY